MKEKRRKRMSFGTSISYFYLSILAVVAAFPLLWILLSSVKSKGEITGRPTSFFPQEITFDYYKNVLDQLGFITNIGNSLLIAGITTLATIIISSFGAYGVVRFFKRFGKAMTRVLITTYMFPPILLAVPYSIIMGKSGLMNTRFGLIIVYLSFSVPYAIGFLLDFSKLYHLK